MDTASSQVRADAAAGVCLVGQDPPGPGAGASWSSAGYPQACHDRLEAEGVVALSGAGDPRQRASALVRGEMNLRAQPAAGTSQRLPVPHPDVVDVGISVIRGCPPCSDRQWRPAVVSPPAAQRRHPGVEHAGHRRRADGRERSWNPRPPSMPGPRPGHSQPAMPTGCAPMFRPLTSADAGCRRSATARTAPADPATASPCGPDGTPHP